MSIAVDAYIANLGFKVEDWFALNDTQKAAYLNHLQAKGIKGIRTPINYESWFGSGGSGNQTQLYAVFANWCLFRGINLYPLLISNSPPLPSDFKLTQLGQDVKAAIGWNGRWLGIWGQDNTHYARCYEVWNEPNSAYGGTGSGTGGYSLPEDYKPLISNATAGIADANHRVLCGGLRNANGPATYLDQLLSDGASFNHLAIHPYATCTNTGCTNGEASTLTNAQAMVNNCLATLSAHNRPNVYLYMNEFGFRHSEGDVAQSNYLTAWVNWLNSHSDIRAKQGPRGYYCHINGLTVEGHDTALCTTSDYVNYADRSAINTWQGWANQAFIIP